MPPQPCQPWLPLWEKGERILNAQVLNVPFLHPRQALFQAPLLLCLPVHSSWIFFYIHQFNKYLLNPVVGTVNADEVSIQDDQASGIKQKLTNVHSLDGQAVWGRMNGYVYMCG